MILYLVINRQLQLSLHDLIHFQDNGMLVENYLSLYFILNISTKSFIGAIYPWNLILVGKTYIFQIIKIYFTLISFIINLSFPSNSFKTTN